MKKILALLILLSLVGCQNEPITVKPTKFKTVMLRSYGEVETLPNMASFYIRLECLKGSVKNSKQCLVEKSNELNDKLLSFGLSQNDILTTSVNLQKRYTWKNNSRVFTGYESSSSLYVVVRDLDKLDEIYTELLENRDLSIAGLHYSHSALDSLKNEAYVSALKNADVLTDRLMEELPESKKEILKIGNVEITASAPDSYDMVYEDYKTSVDEEQIIRTSIAISKGTMTVQAVLYVEYQIK